MPHTSEPSPPSPDLERYRNYLRILALSQLPNRIQGRVDASDLVQETLLDAHKDWAQFAGSNEHELQAWLRKILVRNLLTSLRYAQQQKRDVRREVAITAKVDQSSVCLEKFLAADQTSPSQCVRRGERYERLFEALVQLPDDQRQAVMLKHLHGKSLEEVAAAMDRSLTAAGGLLKRGMSKLRELMAETHT
jgi:RNA polymerase sigma-70 factor (ECF subfamily)